MHIIYVGVHYCNRDTIPSGYPQVLFGLWSSFFHFYSHSSSLWSSRLVSLFETSCCDAPAPFICKILRSVFFFCRFIHLRVLESKCTENRREIKNNSNEIGTYEFLWVLRSFPIDPSVKVTNMQTDDISESIRFLFRKLRCTHVSQFRNRLFSPS
jgi:hypothetical protein